MLKYVVGGKAKYVSKECKAVANACRYMGDMLVKDLGGVGSKSYISTYINRK